MTEYSIDAKDNRVITFENNGHQMKMDYTICSLMHIVILFN